MAPGIVRCRLVSEVPVDALLVHNSLERAQEDKTLCLATLRSWLHPASESGGNERTGPVKV